MTTLISNQELKETMLPLPANEKAIREFASSFNGYEYRETNEAFKKNIKKRENLSDLRSELFLMWRATRQNERINLVEVYKELYPLFVNFLDGKNENT